MHGKSFEKTDLNEALKQALFNLQIAIGRKTGGNYAKIAYRFSMRMQSKWRSYFRT